MKTQNLFKLTRAITDTGTDTISSSGGTVTYRITSIKRKLVNGKVTQTSTPSCTLGSASISWANWGGVEVGDGYLDVKINYSENTESSSRTATLTFTQVESDNKINLTVTQKAGIQMYHTPLHVYISSSPQGNSPSYRLETQDPLGGNIQKGYANGNGKMNEVHPPRMVIQNSIITVNYYRGQVPSTDYVSFKFKMDNGQQLSIGVWNAEHTASGTDVTNGALGYVRINNFQGDSNLARVKARVNMPGASTREWFYVTINVIINPGTRP